ncbi:hypothetical protein BaRGS_00019116 [Batillaria attramentaria]|uniref:Uncharacterized protein n=1 Tax=Batillaria attramentaria TaxID=370345 RepID=A0ABD0KRH5_9CAEN
MVSGHPDVSFGARTRRTLSDALTVCCRRAVPIHRNLLCQTLQSSVLCLRFLKGFFLLPTLSVWCRMLFLKPLMEHKSDMFCLDIFKALAGMNFEVAENQIYGNADELASLGRKESGLSINVNPGAKSTLGSPRYAGDREAHLDEGIGLRGKEKHDSLKSRAWGKSRHSLCAGRQGVNGVNGHVVHAAAEWDALINTSTGLEGRAGGRGVGM